MAIVNELLTYAKHYVNCSTIENIKKMIMNFYSESDIVQAKRLLWSETSGTKLLGKYPERKSTDNRPVSVAHINDIMEALKTLDSADKIPDFVARDLDRLPDCQPEELNLLSLIGRVADLEKTIQLHSDMLSTISIDVMSIKDNAIKYSNVVQTGSTAKRNNSTAMSLHSNSSAPSANTSDSESTSRERNNTHQGMGGRRSSRNKKKPSISSDQMHPNVALSAGAEAGGVSHSGGNAGNLQKDGFQKAMSRRKLRKIFGCASSPVEGLRGAPPPQRSIWVSRVAHGTVESIASFFDKKKIKAQELKKVSHTDAKFSSFKINIGKSDLSKVMTDTFWLCGVSCQIWREPKLRVPNHLSDSCNSVDTIVNTLALEKNGKSSEDEHNKS